MAVRRDYGNFAKASARLLAPQVEGMGFLPLKGAAFARAKNGWVEAFFLQQSQWGSDFCVNIGIDVPALAELSELRRDLGLLIHWRRSDGANEHGAEKWYHAKDKEQLERNLTIVASLLHQADSWFQQFRAFSDVVEQYRVRSGLPKIPSTDLRLLTTLNYGLLLLLDGAKQEAARWLHVAKELVHKPMYWDAKQRTISFQPSAGAKEMKPSEDSERQKRVVVAALARLES